MRSAGSLHCLSSGGVGLAAAHRIPLTDASLSRLSVPTSRLRCCDLGVVGGWSASLLRSGGGPTGTPPGFPCGLGSPRLRLGCGFLSCFLSSRFLSPLPGGESEAAVQQLHLKSASTTHGDEASTYTLDRRGLFSVPCSLECRPTAVRTGPPRRNGG